MIDFSRALKIAAEYIADENEKIKNSKLARLTGIIPDKRLTLRKSYGEVEDKYVFAVEYSTPEEYHGSAPPGGESLTVDKETGECKYEYLEREFLAPYAPIRGYKKINLPEVADDLQ